MNKWITFGEIYLTIQTNAFIYYLGKLPFVKYLVRSTWYSKYGWKHLFSLFGVIIGFVKDAIGKNIGTLLWVYCVPLLAAPDHSMGRQEYFLLFLGVSCLVSLVDGSAIFNSSPQDYTFLYHFMVNPKVYYLYKTLQQVFFSSVMIFPVLCFLLRDALLVTTAVAMKVMCELVGNSAYLFYYRKNKRLPRIRTRQIATVAVFALTYICLFAIDKPCIQFSEISLAVITTIAATISFVCWRFHNRFDNYREIAVTFGNQSMVSLHISVRSVGEDERGLVENPWQENKAYFERFQCLLPAEYLHHAFWERFGKAIRKDNRAQAIVACGFLLIVGLCIRMGWIPLEAEELLAYSPILLSWTLGFSTANKMTQMYFRNIDLHLLYNHMSTEKYIKDSMVRRYLHLLKTDLVFTGVTLVGIITFLLASGLMLPAKTILQLLIISAAVLVMWDTYELMLYYFIQPYTVDLTAKSPLFSFLQVVDGLFVALTLFVRHDLTLAFPVIIALAIIMLIICFVSSRLAYKFFKLRF